MPYMSLYFGLIVTPPLLRSAYIALLFMTEFFFSGAFVAGAGTQQHAFTIAYRLTTYWEKRRIL